MRFIVFIFSALCIFVSCGQHQNGETISPVENSEAPYMYFIEEEHDFGKIVEGTTVSYSFTFENRGKNDLVLYDVRTSCGCTVAHYDKKPIKKGESGKIELRFDTSGKHGKVLKTATIRSNAQPDNKELRLKCEVVLPNK